MVKETEIINNTALKEQQAEQAKLRLRELVKQGLLKDVETAFTEDGTVYYSEHGILYWLAENNNCDELVKVKNRIENKFGALVFFAIKSHTEFGTCLSLMLIGKYEEEWDQELEDLKDGYYSTWTENLDYPDCSEFESIGFKPSMGGLVRTW